MSAGHAICNTINDIIDVQNHFTTFTIHSTPLYIKVHTSEVKPRIKIIKNIMATLTQTQTQPDISYHPDFEKYQLRTERLKPFRKEKSSLPPGFPQQLTGPLVWEGKDFTDEKQWTFSLIEEHLEEIHNALQHFKCKLSHFLSIMDRRLTVTTALDKPIGHVSQASFPLPTLAPLLRQQAQTLSTGRGFFVLRGLRVDSYTRSENIIIYAGVSSHIAPIRGRQDSKLVDGTKQSSMLNHIKDLSTTSVAGKIGAPAYTTDKQVFHTDAGDIVSLFCLQTAQSGGESKLASSWRVYNELARTRPDVIRTLAEDWAFDG